MVSLNIDQEGNVEASGMLKIFDYYLSDLNALIFKLEYRGKYLSVPVTFHNAYSLIQGSRASSQGVGLCARICPASSLCYSKRQSP